MSTSKIIPLAKALQRITASYTGLGTSLCVKLTSQMVSRFAHLKDKSVVAISTLLDPLFKKIPFTDICAVEKM